MKVELWQIPEHASPGSRSMKTALSAPKIKTGLRTPETKPCTTILKSRSTIMCHSRKPPTHLSGGHASQSIASIFNFRTQRHHTSITRLQPSWRISRFADASRRSTRGRASCRVFQIGHIAPSAKDCSTKKIKSTSSASRSLPRRRTKMTRAVSHPSSSKSNPNE